VKPRAGKESDVSIFASQTQSDPIPIPFDPPHTIVVRKVTGKEYQAAVNDSTGRITALFRRALAGGGVTDPAVFAAAADPLLGHDRSALVRAGLVSWSYPQPIAVRPAKGADLVLRRQEQEARDTVIDDLSDEALDFIAIEVLRLTKPALFVAPEAVEDTQKEPTAAAPAA
jgi:hypothetical protein